ncbi:hypothetical protein K1719_018446 [Acacia pycnantha]|nr:hypothetical protein K1719_018446 [Acacia pycnantha]
MICVVGVRRIELLVLQVPVNKVRTYCDLRNVLMKRIFLSAMHFRIKTRYKLPNSSVKDEFKSKHVHYCPDVWAQFFWKTMAQQGQTWSNS